MKKLFSILLVAIMVLGSFSAVFADGTTVKISTDSDTHTYEIYQIFTGDASENAKELLNLKYGLNAVGKTGDAVSQDDIEELSALTDNERAADQADIAAIAKFVNLDSEPLAKIGKGEESKSVDVPIGYYLIKDVDDSLAHPETYTLYLQKVVDADLKIAPKADKPSSEKKVQDINDSDTTPTLSELQDSADYDIQDSVPYTLTATLPSNYTDYKSYYIRFNDDMSSGLTFNGNATIYFGSNDTAGTPITFTEDTKATSEYEGGKVWRFAIDDLKTYSEASAALTNGSIITIKYSATLNDDAVIGADGNPNRYCIDYSNNPNKGADGEKGTTPWDVNIVFTYRAVFNKVDAEGNELTGADFKLEKKVGDSWVEITRKTTNATDTKEATTFTFSGLDDGTYKITETVVPTGYNGIDPIEFVVTADHEILSDNPLLKDVSATGDGIEFDLTSATAEAGFSADIENNSGSVLPETGGMGTTILYTLGGLLVVGAGVLLVARRKMNDR